MRRQPLGEREERRRLVPLPLGHGYSLEALDAENGISVERALWSAFRALEERSAMSRRVARRLADRGRGDSAARFERQAEASARQAAELKQVLDRMDAPTTRAANR